MIDDIQTPNTSGPSPEPTPEPDKIVVKTSSAETPTTPEKAPDAKPEEVGGAPLPFKVGQGYDSTGRKQPKFTEPVSVSSTEPFEPKVVDEKKPKKRKLKKLLIVFIILVLLGSAGFAGWWFGFRDSGTPTTTSTQNSEVVEEEVEAESETSDLVASPLSGLPVSEADAKRPVTSIMIENSGDARPQSGLREADVIFEAIAEGGITRFLALYQAKQPDYIGPVRSARPYYVEWAAAFDAAYAHAGGSPDGIARIGQLGVKDLNAFAFGEDVFFRTDDREAPHNLYTSFAGLDKANSEKGYTSSTFTPWQRKTDVAQTPLAKAVDISISSDFFNVHYDYDAGTNTYLRSIGGEPHLDEKSAKQLAPNTVLVMVMNNYISGSYNVYTTTGSGTFVAFQDGVASEGSWSRSGPKDQYVFTDKYGFPYLFNKGQTWVSVIGSRSDVSFVP